MTAPIVVHRDLGPDYEHVTDGRQCPCDPVVVDGEAPGPVEDLLADVADRLAGSES